MKQTVRLGRVAGIPVGVHWSVLVIMVLLAQGLAMVYLPATAPGRSAVGYWAVGHPPDTPWLHDAAHRAFRQ
jgi:hypothetical protein